MQHFPKNTISIGIPIRSSEVLGRSYLYKDRLETVQRVKKPTNVIELCVTVVPPFVCTWEQSVQVMKLCYFANLANDYLIRMLYSIKGIYMLSFEEELLFCLRVKKALSEIGTGEVTDEVPEFLKTIASLKKDLSSLGITYPTAPHEYCTPHIEICRHRKIKRAPLLLPQPVINIIEQSRKEPILYFTGNKLAVYQKNEKGSWEPCVLIADMLKQDT